MPVGMKIELGDFAEAISTRIWDSVGRANWRSFKDARAFVHSLSLKSAFQWRIYCKTGDCPADIPTHPHIIYTKLGWVSWGDWFGTGRIADDLRKFRTFNKARGFARSLGLKAETEWRKYVNSGKKPDDIPANPGLKYAANGWAGMHDWLGSGRRRVIKLRSFEDARKFVHGLKLKSRAGWREYVKSGRCPRDIPTAPDATYADRGWSGWADWLSIASGRRGWRPFMKARTYARSLGLKSQAEWNAFCRSGNLAEDVPRKPWRVYAELGWRGLSDWLGVPYRRPPDGKWRSFDEARAFARHLGLRSRSAWHEYCRSGRRPPDIPTNPNSVYAGRGWSTWFDWLGAGRHRSRDWLPFENARTFVHGLRLKSHADWIKYCSSGKKPHDIPSAPITVYAKSGWISWGDWLGTGVVAPSSRQYRSFEEARSIARSFGSKSRAEWEVFCKSGKKPADIPAKPERVYAKKGWGGMGDWLGTGRRRGQGWRNFKDARAYVRGLELKSVGRWNEYCKSGGKPADIPSGPAQVYAGEGWTGYGDWLSTGTPPDAR